MYLQSLLMFVSTWSNLKGLNCQELFSFFILFGFLVLVVLLLRAWMLSTPSSSQLQASRWTWRRWWLKRAEQWRLWLEESHISSSRTKSSFLFASWHRDSPNLWAAVFIEMSLPPFRWPMSTVLAEWPVRTRWRPQRRTAVSRWSTQRTSLSPQDLRSRRSLESRYHFSLNLLLLPFNKVMKKPLRSFSFVAPLQLPFNRSTRTPLCHQQELCRWRRCQANSLWLELESLGWSWSASF